jgi:hypothetical protein
MLKNVREKDLKLFNDLSAGAWSRLAGAELRRRTAKALMDEAGFTTLLKRSLVSSESGRGERSLAPTCSAPRRRE